MKFQPEETAILGQDHLLVSGACWLGAYNAGNAYWVMNKKQLHQP